MPFRFDFRTHPTGYVRPQSSSRNRVSISVIISSLFLPLGACRSSRRHPFVILSVSWSSHSCPRVVILYWLHVLWAACIVLFCLLVCRSVSLSLLVCLSVSHFVGDDMSNPLPDWYEDPVMEPCPVCGGAWTCVADNVEDGPKATGSTTQALVLMRWQLRCMSKTFHELVAMVRRYLDFRVMLTSVLPRTL